MLQQLKIKRTFVELHASGLGYARTCDVGFPRALNALMSSLQSGWCEVLKMARTFGTISATDAPKGARNGTPEDAMDTATGEMCHDER